MATTRSIHPGCLRQTGMSLYALHEAGTSVTSDVYRKGVAFMREPNIEMGHGS